MNTRAGIPPEEDAFGAAMLAAVKGELHHPVVIERDDGFIDCLSSAIYVSESRQWESCLKQGLRFVRGKVLDVGAGAGRISLHLQKRGLDVTAVDNSPLAVKAAKAFGVRKAVVTPIEEVASLGSFDTILLLGGNLCLLGTPSKARRILRTFHSMTPATGRIVAQGLDPYRGADQLHLRYHRANRARGRMAGQIRVRIRYKTLRSRWINLLWLSPSELENILSDTGWVIHRRIDDGRMYVVVLAKQS